VDHIDAKVITLVVVATTFLLEILKKLLPKFRENKDLVMAAAAVLPVAGIVIAKLAGSFSGTPWVELLIWALSGGVGAGLLNDKIVNPGKHLIGALFTKKEPPPAAPAEPAKEDPR
jgi:Na+/proline symporter